MAVNFKKLLMEADRKLARKKRAKIRKPNKDLESPKYDRILVGTVLPRKF